MLTSSQGSYGIRSGMYNLGFWILVLAKWEIRHIFEYVCWHLF